MYMLAYHELAEEGKAATPEILKRATKRMKRHRDVTDISFSWISDMMKGIVREMKEVRKGAEKAGGEDARHDVSLAVP